jgi:hypothetical protein
LRNSLNHRAQQFEENDPVKSAAFLSKVASSHKLIETLKQENPISVAIKKFITKAINEKKVEIEVKETKIKIRKTLRENFLKVDKLKKAEEVTKKQFEQF